MNRKIFACTDCKRGPCRIEVLNPGDGEMPEGCPFIPDYDGYARWKVRYP
jgi:hypothetical protein